MISSPSISSDGTIYFGSGDNYLYALTPEGKLKWKFKTGGYVSSSPSISSDGTIYFGSWDSWFYAIKTDSYGLAKSSFPKFRGNLQNTGNLSEIAVAQKPKYPPNLFVSVKFIDEDKNDFLDAEEEGKIIVNVANRGEGEAYGVNLVLNCNGLVCNKLKYEGRKNAGSIKPKEEKRIEIPVSASSSIESGEVKFRIETFEANGFDAEPVLLSFETRKLKEPDLKIASIGIDEIASVIKNGKIELGEAIEVKAIVQNIGEGVAKNVKAEIIIEDSNIYLTSDKYFNLGDIQAGDYKEISFTFSITKRYEGDKILPIYLKLNEKRERFSKKEILGLELGKTTQAIAEVKIKGKEEKKIIKEVPELRVDVDDVPKLAKEKRKNAYAIIVGIENYKYGLPKVDYAEKSATIMKEYLINVLGYEERNVFLLLNDRAGKLDIKKYLDEWLPKNVDGNSEVFFYYTGYGAPDKETGDAYIIPYEGDVKFITTTGYRLKEVYDSLNKLNAKIIYVVLDSCFSGRGGVLPEGAAPVVIEYENIISLSDKIIAFTSSRGDEYSLAYEEKKHRLFTYFFLKGLKGEADRNGDGKIEAVELYNYTKENVDKQARRENQFQTPQILPEEEIIREKGVVIR